MRDGDKEMRELKSWPCTAVRLANIIMNCFLLQAIKGRCLKIALCTVMIKHLLVRVTCLALSQELKTNCSAICKLVNKN